ncbi:DNA repair protein RAD51-like 2, partial [Cucurbita argyrosperma subsp. sororia]
MFLPVFLPPFQLLTRSNHSRVSHLAGKEKRTEIAWFDREIEGDRMTNKLMNQMGLHQSITNIFAERIINTAKEALSLTEFELMELLDVGLLEVASAVAHIIEIASPPYQTTSKRAFNWPSFYMFKSFRFCLKLSLLAALPPSYGSLDGRVIYIDVESKFSSRRMIEIDMRSFPDVLEMKDIAQEDTACHAYTRLMLNWWFPVVNGYIKRIA